MHPKSKFYIDKLELRLHPEGGFYKEIYRSGELYYVEDFVDRKKRSASTSIFFLLDGKQVSKFHKLKSDEIWHFYDGTSIKLYLIDSESNLSEIIIGKNLDAGETYQFSIPKNNWFAAELMDKKSFALMGCTVAPGFDFEDFELGKRGDLVRLYPEHHDLIMRLTGE